MTKKPQPPPKPPAPPREIAITNRIITWLNAQPHTLARKLHGTGYGHAGDPDIYGSFCGLMFQIEVKRPGGTGNVTQRQTAAMEAWSRTGAMVMIAYSLKEVQVMFNSAMEAPWFATYIAARWPQPVQE